MFPFPYAWWTPILLPIIASGHHRKIFPYDLDGPFKQTLMSLFRLAWSSKVQLPLLITVVFMTFDIQLQVEINIIWEGRREVDPDPLPEQEGEELRLRRNLIRQIHAGLLAPLAPEEDSDNDDEDVDTSDSSSSSDDEDDDDTSSVSSLLSDVDSTQPRRRKDGDDDDQVRPGEPHSRGISNGNGEVETHTSSDASNENSSLSQSQESTPTAKHCDELNVSELVATEQLFEVNNEELVVAEQLVESVSCNRISYVPLWNVLKRVLEFQKRVTSASQIPAASLSLPKCIIAQRLETEWYKNIDLAPR